MGYKLVLVNAIPGVETSSSWTLELPASIGRDPDHEVCINHDSISRTHCRLSLNGEGALLVHDLNSTNGTYVDDKKVARTLLTPGDTLQIGSVMLRIEYASDTDHGNDHGKTREKPEAYKPAVTVPMGMKTLPARKKHSALRKWWQFW